MQKEVKIIYPYYILPISIISTPRTPELPNLINTNRSWIRLLLYGIVGLVVSEWECTLHAPTPIILISKN